MPAIYIKCTDKHTDSVILQFIGEVIRRDLYYAKPLFFVRRDIKTILSQSHK